MAYVWMAYVCRLKKFKLLGEIKDTNRHSRVKFANLILNDTAEDNF